MPLQSSPLVGFSPAHLYFTPSRLRVCSMIESRCIELRRANGPAGFASRSVIACTAPFFRALGDAGRCAIAGTATAKSSMAPAKTVKRERGIKFGFEGVER